MSIEKYHEVQHEDWQQVKVVAIKYIKIVALSFLLPLSFCVLINEATVLWKIFSWYKLDIAFWNIPKYYSSTILILLIPIVYLIWFYYVLLEKILLQLHNDFFQYWNIEIGNLIAKSMIDLNSKNMERENPFDLDVVIMYLNRKLSKLPKLLEWAARKVMDQIPIMEFVNAYDVKDLDNMDVERLSYDITDKINRFELDLIGSIKPGWTMFIIPVNVILLFIYIKL